LVREVTALYAARSRGQAPRLPELPVQYADFAVWQRAWLSGEVLEEQIGYWKARLAGAPPLLEIPTDRPRAVGQSPLAGSHPFRLPAGLSQGLRELSRREGTTLFMTLLAAWQALLGRYAGQEDVVVGTPIAGRGRRETEGLIGFFVNLLALRADLSGDPTWTELLGRVREAALGAYDHQELPFEKLVEELEVERSLAHSPLFQVVFTVNAADGGEPPSLGDLAVEPFGGGADLAKFDLDLGFQGGDGALAGLLQYRAALLDAETAARMAGHLEALLGAMASTPERRLSELSLLRGEERAQVLHAWNATARSYPRDLCLHELAAAQARRTPDAPSVVSEAQALTYAELDADANRLAHLLRRHGVGPETRVAIGLERSPGMVLAVLAVLKAGGAYVPLDPAHPAERVAYVLADSGAALVLTEARLAARFATSGVPSLALDALRSELAAEPAGAPESGVTPDNLAYVIYTSGSTGQPKGVLVQHRSAVNFMYAVRDFFGLTARDRVLQFHSLSFDVSVEEIFVALLAGAVLVLRDEEMPGSAARFFEWCAERGVTALELPTAYWHELAAELDHGEARLPACVRLVVVGGERMLPERVAQWRRRVGDAARLVNSYGPTEATVASTLAHVGEGVLSIGGPVANVRTYVLEPTLEPAPVGVPGELWIGGAGVARGYLGQPGATAERFTPDPFCGEVGARMYRSGDRVRWLATGELEYLGRIDAQVKVRGFRIEPGEVEAALRGHAAVRDAVVVVRAEEQRLAAYVVPEAGAGVSAAELRAHLAGRLPEYMVPGAFVLLEALPLTVSGKVDRWALPAPGRQTEHHVAPRTAAEEVLAGIWAEVLRLERVGVEQSFFELGGHSLLAMRVVSRVREAFGVELPLRALFEAPTVAALAGRIEVLRGAGPAAAPPIEPVSRAQPLPLSFAQQRLWLVDRIDPGSPAYNMAAALRLRGALDADALRASLDALVARHETLRTTFAERGGRPVQVIHPAAPAPLPIVDLSRLPAGARERAAEGLAGAEAMRPFDLARGPLLRSILVRLGETDHVLCFNVHHVVSDGWSMQLLVREVSAVYAAARRGEPAALEELPVQYADYAVWQRSWLTGETLEAQLGYWRERLAGAPPLLEVPTDRPRAAGPDPRAEAHGFHLAPELSRRLRELSRGEGATLFMTLLAGWQALLGRYAGQDDVVVGSAVAGRNRGETEGLIGFFVNMLALRADLSGDPTWAELLGRTRETALGAHDHQELPFEKLVEELGVERSLTHTPVFQTNFTLDVSSGGDERLELGELGLELFGSGARAAKFDLDLLFDDGGEALAGTIVYRPALFDAATIGRMAAHFTALLEAMTAGPRRRTSELSLLGGAERAQLLEEWNATAAALPRACFHELFAEQAARAPEAPAVDSGAGALTYGRLEHAANRLANHLRRRGVGPETRVAVCLERGAELVVALLGVLKAGGAYVPLDPAYPAARLAFMLADSGAALLLTRLPLLDRLPPNAGETVCLDADGERIAAESPRAPDAGVLPENLAYVIYTSGSTGTPKGVLVPHRGLANVGRAQAREVGVGAGDRLLQFASPGFDASVSEMTLALAAGGTLVAGTRETLAPGPDLLRFLREA
ncbi:MAG TPA: amino acid adenylation domain-containing protein, partial [Longimicrobiaceae bacterium]|nr:amino acid adenylation domain-containing protein [Longimicrobiaceae bacterium]